MANPLRLAGAPPITLGVGNGKDDAKKFGGIYIGYDATGFAL